ncbi:MAG: CdaR family protein [Gemmiger sp.]|nr:CdaR family protein [Gemmiger sp.]
MENSKPKAAPEQPAAKKVIWDNRPFMLVLSLVAAVLAWLLVIMVFDPQSNITVGNVEVNYAYDSTKYTSQGLDIVEKTDVNNVVVQLDGNGTIIGDIKASDFVVYPNYSNVKGSGEVSLSLLVRITNTQYSSGITASVVSPKTVQVVFDTVSQKNLPVEVDSSTITVKSGYALTNKAAVPAEVTLSGPTKELDGIAKAVAHVTTDAPLDDSTTLEAPLELQDADGNVVVPEYATLDNASATVTLTVYAVRELPLTIDFINVPSGFDTSTLQYSLSQETLQVAGPVKTINALSALSVVSFDLASQFAFDRDYQLPVELPSGLVSQDGVSSVTLSFDTANMGTKQVNVSNIRCINVPSNYDITVLSDRVSGVTLYGPAEEIEALSPDSVVAQIDCQSISVSAGQQIIPVSISIPASSKIFATGSYTVQCQIDTK